MWRLLLHVRALQAAALLTLSTDYRRRHPRYGGGRHQPNVPQQQGWFPCHHLTFNSKNSGAAGVGRTDSILDLPCPCTHFHGEGRRQPLPLLFRAGYSAFSLCISCPRLTNANPRFAHAAPPPCATKREPFQVATAPSISAHSAPHQPNCFAPKSTRISTAETRAPCRVPWTWSC